MYESGYTEQFVQKAEEAAMSIMLDPYLHVYVHGYCAKCETFIEILFMIVPLCNCLFPLQKNLFSFVSADTCTTLF